MLGTILGRSKILIQGAGVAGLALAGQCKAKGIPFTLVEQASALPTSDAGLILPFNAVDALKRMGLQRAVRPYAHPITEVQYTTPENLALGKREVQTGVLQNTECYSIRRSNLLSALQAHSGSPVHFGVQIEHAEITESGVMVRFKDDRLPPAKYDAVIGADGIDRRYEI